MSEDSPPLMAGKIDKVSHVFPSTGVRALNNVSLDLARGEILAIAGENGAGKSTLMSLISGRMEQTEGLIQFPEGESLACRQKHCGMIHQNPRLAGSLNILENMVLATRGTIFWPSKSEREIQQVQECYGLPLDLKRKSSSLNAAQIQRCELIRALWLKKDVLILDEPTASLSDSQTQELFTLLRTLGKEGKTILFISHKIQEILELAQRIAVLRQGELQICAPRGELTPAALSRLMIGEGRMEENFPLPPSPAKGGNTLLELKSISLFREGIQKLDSLNFSLKSGEILGIGGIRENGLDQLEGLLTGLIHPTRGEILLNGRNWGPLSPYQLRRQGISYVPADRLKRGAAPESTVAENLSILKKDLSAIFGSYKKGIFHWAAKRIGEFRIKAEPRQQVNTLSGGNIQKMIAARELEGIPPVLIVSEPGWGLDFNSRTILHQQILEAGKMGTAVLLLTSDLDELLSLSHRAYILAEGRLTALQPIAGEWNRTFAGEIMTGARRT